MSTYNAFIISTKLTTMRFIFVFIALCMAFGVNAQEDSLIRKRSVRIVDFNHPKNYKVKYLPWIMLSGINIIWAYKDEDYGAKLTKEELFDIIDYDTLEYSTCYTQEYFDSIAEKRIRGEVVIDTCIEKLSKFANVAKVKLIIEDVYNQQGVLQNQVYNCDQLNDHYDYLKPPKIKFIVFLNAKGEGIAYFDYHVVSNNILIFNPQCWYVEKNKKLINYFELLEQEDYYYEEVEGN